jgi:GntR family transcriptional regulator
VSINPNRPEPIFQQAAAHIRSAIAAGVYRAGEMIPSVRALALELRVNPNTIQRAYEALEREGLISARKGLGMFVTRRGTTMAVRQTQATARDHLAHSVAAALAAGIASDEIQELVAQLSREVERESEVMP